MSDTSRPVGFHKPLTFLYSSEESEDLEMSQSQPRTSLPLCSFTNTTFLVRWYKFLTQESRQDMAVWSHRLFIPADKGSMVIPGIFCQDAALHMKLNHMFMSSVLMVLSRAAWHYEREGFNCCWSERNEETVALKEQRPAFISPSLSEKRIVQHPPCHSVLLLGIGCLGMTTIVQPCFLLHF